MTVKRFPIVLVAQQAQAAKTDAPRRDIDEIAQRLQANVLMRAAGDNLFSRFIAQMEKRSRLDVSVMARLPGQARQSSVVLSTSEKVALPAAFALRAAGVFTPHVMIGHKLSSGRKQALFARWPPHQFLSDLITVSRCQCEYAVHELRFPAERVHFLPDKVDQHFFTPCGLEPLDYVLAVGQEQRDYETLACAIEGLPLRLVIVASSPWSSNAHTPAGSGQIDVVSGIPYTQLRALYDQARMVVVPLRNVDYAAGANGLLEAMSMGKPVILSDSAGMKGYIDDGVTGVLTPCHDAPALRERILMLLRNEPEGKRLGANARDAVLAGMNMDAYVTGVCAIVQSASTRADTAHRHIDGNHAAKERSIVS